jgi:enterochelin esterase-like enzyme
VRYRRATIVVLVVLAAAAAAGAAILRESRDLDETIRSVALSGRVHARVVLPPGYSDSKKHYPVVYFLHGLPANAAAYRGNDWLIDELERAGPAILVIPQGARVGDTDPEYLNWGAGRNWETYVATEVPRYVDAHFRTINSRSGRALVGVSAGGYGAMILGLHHLGEFSVIESWSGYFHPTDPTGTVSLSREPAASAQNLVGDLRSDERQEPTFIGFYVGRGDTRFRADNQRFDAQLTAAHVPHTFAVYPGAHTTALWEAHGTAWLQLALRHLAAAR